MFCVFVQEVTWEQPCREVKRCCTSWHARLLRRFMLLLERAARKRRGRISWRELERWMIRIWNVVFGEEGEMRGVRLEVPEEKTRPPHHCPMWDQNLARDCCTC